MDREECQKQITDLMIQIYKVYHEYNPYGKYISMFIRDDFVYMNNAYYAGYADHPLCWDDIIEPREK